MRMISGIKLPTRGSRQADPAVTISTYERAVARPQEKTRDPGKYAQMRAKLIAHGSARNVYQARSRPSTT